MAKAEGLLQELLPVGLFQADVRYNLDGRRGHVLSMSTIGTQNVLYVTAFTRGNDLPRNAQTVLSCLCAMGTCPGVMPYGLTVPNGTSVV